MCMALEIALKPSVAHLCTISVPAMRKESRFQIHSASSKLWLCLTACSVPATAAMICTRRGNSETWILLVRPARALQKCAAKLSKKPHRDAVSGSFGSSFALEVSPV